MPEFNNIRKNLNDSLSQKERARKELFLQQEKLKQVEADIYSLQRRFDQNSKVDLQKQSQLKDQLSTLNSSIAKAQSDFANYGDELKGILENYHLFSDPRKNIAQLDDHNPIMLLPLRIETRFKKVLSNGREENQLWVRVYPDDIAIDSFEEILSKAEITSAQDYWHGIRQAAGREMMERAAWRGLVSSYGSGRARYIIEKFFPETDAFTADEHDLILTIGTDKVLVAEEIPIIKKFWKELWLAGTDIIKRQDARNYLIENLLGTTSENESRAKEIEENLKPSNFGDFSRFSEEELKVTVVFINFPKGDEISTKEESWSQAPKTKVLPDRFVITGYDGPRHSTENISFQEIGNPIPPILSMGPDPSLSEKDQLKQVEGDLIVNEDLKWMFDFDVAVEKGMGFKINLTENQMRLGFDRIVVLGLKISSDEAQSIASIEQLFHNHERTKKGLAILPQGTPTNNTQSDDSAYQYLEDADVSFDQLQNDKQFVEENDWLSKRDGQWLAEWLGVNPEVFQKTYNSSLGDQSEAKAMNIALFPATLGYTMESMMKEVFTENDLEQTRFFFNNFVSARGCIPAIKIGRQPYGILPATKFDSMKWLNSRMFPMAEKIPFIKGMEFFVPKLYDILKKIDSDWRPMLDKVDYVGKDSDDAQKLLLRIVGLTPNSIEHYQRYAESEFAVHNRFRIGNYFYKFPFTNKQEGLGLLKEFGYDGQITPEILKKIFLKSQNKLKRPLIDDVPLSEVLGIRDYAKITTDSGEEEINYIEWLKNAAETSHNTLRLQKGFIDDKVPTTLLYLMLKHSLDLGYINTSLYLNLKAKIINEIQVRDLKIDPNVVHIQTNKAATESRWKYLYETNSTITGNDKMLLGDYIPKLFNTELASSYLKEQLNALSYLQNAPTARLERVFTEHIDLCTYRLDAWKNALLTYQLSVMRFVAQKTDFDNIALSSSYSQSQRKKGTYLGAYGWLEDIRPENKEFTAVTLSEKCLADNFADGTEPPLMRDSTNGGYIAAPSLDHAVTAAILRNAYMSDDSPEVFKINLSSGRVRKALSIIEGIRAGQNLSALLGYYLERELRNKNDDLPDIDFYIHLLRNAFPLNLSKINDTKIEVLETEEAIVANNVVDGLAIINQIKKTGNSKYPFGKSLLPVTGADAPSDAIKATINAEVDNITNLNDAIADIAMAESIHQVVLGNYDRAAATLETYSKGNFPPIPDVIQTPRKGISITQRFGLHFKIGDSSDFSNPRGKAEPSMASWLKGILPDSKLVAVSVNIKYQNGTAEKIQVLQSKLELEALDLLYLLNTEDDKSMTALDDIIEHYIYKQNTTKAISEIKILYTERIPDITNFFQLAAQISSLRKLLLQSRPLEPLDVSLALEANSAENNSIYLETNKLDAAVNVFNVSVSEISTYLGYLSPLLLDLENNRQKFIDEYEALTEQASEFLSKLSWYGLAQTGTAFIYEKKRAIFSALRSKAESILTLWNNQLAAFDVALQDFNNLPPDAEVSERFLLMYQLENTIDHNPTVPQPTTLVDFQTIIDQKRADFIFRKDTFKSDLVTVITSKNLLNLLKALEVDGFEISKYNLVDQENAIIDSIEELANTFTALLSDLKIRILSAQDLITEANTFTNGKKKVELIQDAAKKFFGEDFKMIPSFSLPERQASEWANSYNDSDQLLDYQKNISEVKSDFPVDEWVYSLARVREKVREWEKLILVSEALSEQQLELKPIQLPYKEHDTWVALDYPRTYKIENDKMLYTAHYAVEFDKNAPQCGLLLDEWTELIPSEDEEVGISFHYDRPNSEPPQVILLAMPTEFKGHWEWNDLLGVVNDTLDQAKKRAIEPEQIDETKYAKFLPATISSVVHHPIMPSLNLSFVNLVYNFLTPQNNE